MCNFKFVTSTFFPFAYIQRLHKSVNVLKFQVAVGKKAADALRTYRGTNYRVGSAARLLCKQALIKVVFVNVEM